MNIPLMLKALSLMTQDEAEQYLTTQEDTTAYVECATRRIYGTHKGLPILLAGNADWKHALCQLTTKAPRRTAFGYYLFD